MDSGIRVGRIRIEGLANDEAGFAMLIALLAEPMDVRGERAIAGHALPNIMHCVVREPHVRAAAGNHVGIARGIVFHAAGMLNTTDVPMALEHSQGGWRVGRAE